MTRAERLQQAQAALLLGFADGCRRAKRHDEAADFAKKAVDVWPNIHADITKSDAEPRGLIVLYGDGATRGEFETDDFMVSR